MTATRVCDLPHANALIKDPDTVYIGGSAFVREYRANYHIENAIDYKHMICNKCNGITIFRNDKPIYCSHCGAKFTSIEQLPTGIPEHKKISADLVD